MSAFSKMKNKRKDFGALADQLQKSDRGSNNSNFNDDRVWEYKANEKGNYSGEIRFLPAKDGEDTPFVKTFNHFFKAENGRWFIDVCPTTAGLPCPVCEENTRFLEGYGGWNDAPDSAKEVVRNRKRGQQYVSNIYIVNDPANPENNGKVFLFKYGPRIYRKIMDAVSPEFEDDNPIDPFDFWEGATFKLKVRKVDGQTNYDSSEFMEPAPLLDDDDELEKVWKSQYSINEFIDPEKMTNYDDMKKRLNRVLGKQDTSGPKTAEEMSKNRAVEETSPSKTVDFNDADDDTSSSSPAGPSLDDDDDDTMSFFKDLAEED